MRSQGGPRLYKSRARSLVALPSRRTHASERGLSLIGGGPYLCLVGDAAARCSAALGAGPRAGGAPLMDRWNPAGIDPFPSASIVRRCRPSRRVTLPSGSVTLRTSPHVVEADCASDQTSAASGTPTDSAAVLTSFATSSGCDTIATWLVETSTVVAPMRLANCRSASGGIAWSPSATRYHEGSDFQAGTPMTSPRAEPASGCCTAYITLALIGSTSAAKWLTKSSSGSHAKPCWSTSRCVSAGLGGP